LASLKTARTWGGLGAIFSLFYMTYFIGFVLKLFAVKEIAEATGRLKIFKDYTWAALLNITASFIFSWAFYEMLSSYEGVMHNPDELEKLFSQFGNWLFIGTLVLIAGVWFMKKSYDAITEATGVGSFHTAALMYLIGAVLSLFFIGYFFILLGAIYEIMAFFGLPEGLPEASTTPAPDAVE